MWCQWTQLALQWADAYYQTRELHLVSVTTWAPVYLHVYLSTTIPVYLYFFQCHLYIQYMLLFPCFMTTVSLFPVSLSVSSCLSACLQTCIYLKVWLYNLLFWVPVYRYVLSVQRYPSTCSPACPSRYKILPVCLYVCLYTTACLPPCPCVQSQWLCIFSSAAIYVDVNRRLTPVQLHRYLSIRMTLDT